MLDPNTQIYVGEELHLFEKATNWKQYYAGLIKPYLKGSVLEVGAGLGGTTTILCDGSQTEWLCLEPDMNLCAKVEQLIEEKYLPSYCKTQNTTIDEVPTSEKFDAIIYIDVVEHIEHDREEMIKAVARLKKGGYIAIIVPAFQFFFSPFDKAVGHYRRYDKKLLSDIIPQQMTQTKLQYLDSVGAMASLTNKFFLKQSYPTEKQVLLWDKNLVPISKLIDPLINYSWGKSLLGVWQKN